MARLQDYNKSVWRSSFDGHWDHSQGINKYFEMVSLLTLNYLVFKQIFVSGFASRHCLTDA